MLHKNTLGEEECTLTPSFSGLRCHGFKAMTVPAYAGLNSHHTDPEAERKGEMGLCNLQRSSQRDALLLACLHLLKFLQVPKIAPLVNRLQGDFLYLKQRFRYIHSEKESSCSMGILFHLSVQREATWIKCGFLINQEIHLNENADILIGDFFQIA